MKNFCLRAVSPFGVDAGRIHGSGPGRCLCPFYWLDNCMSARDLDQAVQKPGKNVCQNQDFVTFDRRPSTFKRPPDSICDRWLQQVGSGVVEGRRAREAVRSIKVPAIPLWAQRSLHPRRTSSQRLKRARIFPPGSHSRCLPHHSASFSTLSIGA